MRGGQAGAASGQGMGTPVGYKGRLTSEPAQKAFGASAPVRGVLYADMMLEDGASVPANWRALPRFEADMIVVVADDGVNAATSPQEALAHISAVHPFIELPDLVVDTPRALHADIITAINVGARKASSVRPSPPRGASRSCRRWRRRRSSPPTATVGNWRARPARPSSPSAQRRAVAARQRRPVQGRRPRQPRLRPAARAEAGAKGDGRL